MYWDTLTEEEQLTVVSNRITTKESLQGPVRELLQGDTLTLETRTEEVSSECPEIEDLASSMTYTAIILEDLDTISNEIAILKSAGSCPHACGLLHEALRSSRMDLGLSPRSLEEEADIIKDLRELGLED